MDKILEQAIHQAARFFKDFCRPETLADGAEAVMKTAQEVAKELAKKGGK